MDVANIVITAVTTAATSDASGRSIAPSGRPIAQ